MRSFLSLSSKQELHAHSNPNKTIMPHRQTDEVRCENNCHKNCAARFLRIFLTRELVSFGLLLKKNGLLKKTSDYFHKQFFSN